MATATTDPTAQGNAPGQSASSDAFDTILAQLQQQIQGGGATTLSGNPWDVSFALQAPVYSLQQHTKQVPFVGPIPTGTPRPNVGTEKYMAVVPSDKSGQQWLMDFAKSADPHTVSEVQARLATLGYLAPDSYRVGDGTDEQTQQAMAGVLRVAYLRGITPDQAIDYLQKYTPKSQTLAGQAAAKKQSDAEASQKAAYDAYTSNLNSVYLRTWGVPAPPGYVDRAAKAGMNIYEFEAHERSKPAFENSAQGQTERVGLEAQIAQWMGRG